MGTVKVETTSEIIRDGVCIFQQDVVAHVNWELAYGDVDPEWTVEKFEFQDTKFIDGKRVVLISVFITKDDGPLFQVLLSGIEHDHFAEALNDAIHPDLDFSYDPETGEHTPEVRVS